MTIRTVMASASMLVTTLVVAVGVPGTVLARGRWQDVLAPRGGGHAAVSSLGAEPKSAPDRSPERVRSPAPAQADDSGPPARSRSPRILDHEAGDRLREALAAAQDDPRSAGKIQRLIAQAAAEARRNRALGERVWYWRDPFSENPRRPIVLSLEVQLEMQLWQAREELARAHVASNTARVEAAAAHVEAARARVEAARAEGGKARSPVARQDSRSTRGLDEEALLAPPRQPPIAREGDSDGPAIRKRPARRAVVPKTALARNETAAAPGNRHRDIGAARAVAVPATDSEEPRTDPATWRSADPRGIVVVPIVNTNASAAPTNPTLARRR